MGKHNERRPVTPYKFDEHHTSFRLPAFRSGDSDDVGRFDRLAALAGLILDTECKTSVGVCND
jgi:hypothetical protein